MAAGSCATCPSRTSSASGSDELTDCVCVAGYTAASDGVACSACEAGEYKATMGVGNCTVCPSHTSSAEGSDEVADCVCLAGYSGPSDGVPCSACEAGTYKAVPGAGECSACPAGTSSGEASDEKTDCICVEGYMEGLDGVQCTACHAGTFKSVAGTGECATCPANSESAAGRALCYCSAGFRGEDGGACDACSACTSVVTFNATLAVALTEFSAATRRAYAAGVAQALSLAPSSVAIASVNPNP